MLLLCFAAIYVVAVCAESPSIGSYSSQGGSLRDYEYSAGRSGESYVGAKPSYGEFAGSYVSLTGAPYSKGETRYMSTSDSNSESSDTRTGLTSVSSGSNGGNGGSNSASNSGTNSAGSFYKAKYASDATINAIRPSYQSLPGSSPAAPTSSGTSEEATLQGQNPTYTFSASQSTGGTGPSSSYYGQEQQLPSTYVASGEPASHSEYVSVQGRPSASVYPGYAVNSPTGEYVHSRPSSYNFGGLSSAASQMAISDYSSGSRHHVHASYPISDEPAYQGHAMSAPSHPYKSYIVSNPPSSYSSSKYQTVLGALKSLFGGGNAGTTEAAASPSHHPPSYLAAPHSYYSPVHSASHHTPALMTPLSSVASPSSHYFSPGSGTSNSQYSTAYSKNYPPMRLTSSYGFHSGSSASSGSPGGPGGPGSPGSPGKIILVRDGSAAHGATYPSAAGSLLPSQSAYAAVKNKISYISAAPSSLSYSTAHSGTYPGSAAFPSTHGGSTFLGYSAN